ncbi:MAG: deoxyguanosinetriphosphate triphosphohydrolase [Actinomycetes bacterium]
MSSSVAAYGEHDAERRVREPAKAAGLPRSPYERDRARVLHSAALRRLAAKTQVVTVGVDDFPRTRLTHSLECAQIGRELGAALGADPDIVDAACLAHDLGHPPFGHTGEDALDDAVMAAGGFEGNAQSLRILTRLEAKVADAELGNVGLNLTRAVLDATIKYPWPRRADTPKYGVYPDDAEMFAWIRDGVPTALAEDRSFEAQIMDWADDVAYSVHDLEDGIHAGHIDLAMLDDPDEREAVISVTKATYGDTGLDAGQLEQALGGLRLAPWWPLGYDGSQGALRALKRMTSELIARFCAAAYDATRVAYPGTLRRYDANLVVPPRTRAECTLLKGVATRYVMTRPGVADRQRRQRDVVQSLVAALIVRAPAVLEPWLQPLWRDAPGDAARLRIIADQVASLTDTSALAWHNRLRAG